MKKVAYASLAASFFLTGFLALCMMVPNGVVAQGVNGTTPPAASSTPNISFTLQNPLGSSTTTLSAFLTNILNAVVLLLTPVIVLMMIYAGFLFVTAQGNTEKLGEAKKALLYTLIGAALVLGAKGFALVIQNTVTCLAGSTC